ASAPARSPVNRSIFRLQVRVRDQRRAQSRVHIVSAGGNGFVDLRFNQGCSFGLGFFRTLRSIHVGTIPVRMRTEREPTVNREVGGKSGWPPPRRGSPTP